jgi:hypothetical protein
MPESTTKSIRNKVFQNTAYSDALGRARSLDGVHF